MIHSNYIKSAENLFCPSKKTNSKYGFFKETFLSISTHFQKNSFINDFSKKISELDSLKIEETSPEERMKLCESKIKQLNTLFKVHDLIVKSSSDSDLSSLNFILISQMDEARKLWQEAKTELERANPTPTYDGLSQLKKWTGIGAIETGIKEIRNERYTSGIYNLAFGSIQVAAIASLTIYLVNQFFLKNQTVVVEKIATETPPSRIPTIDRAQIQSESFNHVEGKRNITIITAYDQGIKDYADHVIPNQRDFAKKQGYNYIEYFGNLAHDRRRPRAPYWSKIVALQDQLTKTQENEWIAWTDASALFTNSNKNFDQVIELHGENKDIILTTDPQVPINNAVFLIKNTAWTRNWIQEIWDRVDLARGGEGNCWSWGHPFCHYEQQAMTELWEKSAEVRSHTALIPNKEMNSFYRYSHFDPYRNIEQTYDGDPLSSKWQPGDFICKVTGMDRDRRLAIIKHVAQNCIDRFCARQEFHPT